MKRSIWVFSVCLTLVIAISLGSAIYLERSSKLLIAQSEEALAAVLSGETQRASDIINKLNADWQRHQHLWEVVAVHEEVGVIAEALLEARISIDTNESTNAIYALSRLSLLLESVPHKESFRLENVF